MFIDSQSNAEIEALRDPGYPNVVYVGDIPEGSPSEGALQPQDRITAVDGTPVTDYDSLAKVMSTTKPGHPVTVTVLRNGVSVDEKVTLTANAKVWSSGLPGR